MHSPAPTRSFATPRSTKRRLLDQRRARDTRFPASLLKNLHFAGSFVRRCFSRVLLKMNLVGKESPRCLTLSADRAETFPVEQAAEPIGYLNYSESALLNSNRLSEGAKRMSLSRRASEQRKRVITSAPWACCLLDQKMTNDPVVRHLETRMLHRLTSMKHVRNIRYVV